MGKVVPYTKEMHDWIEVWYPNTNYSINEIIEMFNKKFNSNRKYYGFVSYCSEHGIKRATKIKWTEEKIIWLKNHYSYLNDIDRIVEEFEKEFNCYVNSSVICSALYKHKISTNNIHPIGVPFEKKHGKRTSVLVRVKNGSTKNKNGVYKTYSNYIWEQNYGAIPENYFVINLDGNKWNCDLDNLYLVSRHVNSYMVKNGWYSTNKDITLAAIKIAELCIELKKKETKYD